jgi:RNA polymerase sigma-70 factor (ECF subfamily)
LEAEQEILRLIGENDGSGFDKMVDLFGPMLYRYARRMCGQTSEAEDVLQDTFLTAQTKISQFRGEGRLRNWLFTITGNACRQRQRKLTGRRYNELSIEDVLPNREEVLDRSPSTWLPSPVDAILSNELAGKLEAAIAKVPAPNRAALLLRDVEGLSTRETAVALELTEAAVKVRLHRARAFVRKELRPYYEGKS